MSLFWERDKNRYILFLQGETIYKYDTKTGRTWFHEMKPSRTMHFWEEIM